MVTKGTVLVDSHNQRDGVFVILSVSVVIMSGAKDLSPSKILHYVQNDRSKILRALPSE